MEPKTEALVQSGPVLKLEISSQSTKARVAQWIEWKLKDPNLTNKAIAEKIGIAPQTLNNCISRARKEGWLELSDPMDRVEHEIIPKTVENVINFLDAKSEKVTIEAMKGLLFPIYKDSIGVHEAPKTVLSITIESAPHDTLISPSGTITGKPRSFIDAEEVKLLEEKGTEYAR